MVFLHGSMVIIARGASRNVRIVEKCQNCKNLPINGIVYFHHGDNNIVYTRFNNYNLNHTRWVSFHSFGMRRFCRTGSPLAR